MTLGESHSMKGTVFVSLGYEILIGRHSFNEVLNDREFPFVKGQPCDPLSHTSCHEDPLGVTFHLEKQSPD